MMTCLPVSASWLATSTRSGSEEIGFVDADHLGAPVHLFQDFFGAGDDGRLHALVAVGDDFVGGIAVVEGGFENLHSFAGDLGAAQAADQFLALAGKHRAADDLDPSDVAGDDVHN